jgi:protein-S-isoprenylcysteine O-methyltransferase Ste14
MGKIMKQKMTRWGVGLELAFFFVLYSLIIIAFHLYYGEKLRVYAIPYWILATGGVVLIVIGIIFLVAARKKIKRTFGTGMLCTIGVYSICRHPVYASWVIFIVPGLVLLANSWAALTIPPVMYVILRILVSKEEQYLEQKFGDEFRSYKKRVPAVLPLGWLKRE